jgi:hypothetical protein
MSLIKRRVSLARSNHSLTVHVISLLSDSDAEKQNEPQYALLPALPAGATGGEASGVQDEDSDSVPAARTRHAACAFNVCVAMFGGVDKDGETIEEKGRIWLFNTAKSTWEFIGPKLGEHDVPEARAEGKLLNCENNLVLKDTWHFSYADKTWTRLPDAPQASTNASLANGVLWLLNIAPETNGLNGYMHSLAITSAASPSKPTSWTTQSFPTNPLTPSPKPRVAGGLLPMTTGHGRHYLLHFFGVTPPTTKEDLPPTSSPDETTLQVVDTQAAVSAEPIQYPDLWTLQLPSTTPGRKASWSESLRPAALKDSIRSAFKADTGTNAWAEVDVQPPALETLGDGESGKVHPGPRAYFGCDVLKDGSTVMIWGGVNAKGERESDGWLVSLG